MSFLKLSNLVFIFTDESPSTKTNISKKPQIIDFNKINQNYPHIIGGI